MPDDSSSFSFATWRNATQKVFSAKIRRRGAEYFRQGRVSIDEATPFAITALVEGSRSYFVELQRPEDDPDLLGAYCDCPYAERGYLCKHMWAVILAADNELSRGEKASGGEAAWRDVLFPGAAGEAPGRWSGRPGEYVLLYRLDVSSAETALTVVKQKVLKSGKYGKQSGPAPLNILDERDLPAVDHGVLSMLRAEFYREYYESRFYYHRRCSRRFERIPVPLSVLRFLLPELAATGRCSVFYDGGEISSRLALGDPFEATPAFPLDAAPEKEQGEHLVYAAHVRLGDVLRPIEDIPVFLATDPLLFFLDGALHALPGPDIAWVSTLRRNDHRVRVPASEARELYLAADKLVAEGGPCCAPETPEEYKPVLRDKVSPIPCLEIALEDDAAAARLWVDYDGFEVEVEDPRPAILDTASWTRLKRDMESEDRFHLMLLDQGLEVRGDGFTHNGGPAQLLDAALPLLDAGWTLRSRDKRTFRKGAPPGLKVSSGVDWFDIRGEIDFGGAAVPLPTAVRAFVRGEKIIELPDGGLGVLPEAWMARHAASLDMAAGRSKDGALRCHSAHALLLDSLLEEVGEQAMPAEFVSLRKRMKRFSGITPPDPPRDFQGALRPYQHDALGWFDFLADFGFGGILADDMGLGKTIQVLAWIALEKERGPNGPSLVIAPTSLVFHWRDEAARFCPGLSVLAYTGLKRKGLAKTFSEHDVVLTTYGLLRRDIQTLRETRWRTLILDESQAVKNPGSQTAKAARVLAADRRLCMTGTPLENRLDDLWSQFQILNPNLFGSRARFNERFAASSDQNGGESHEILKRMIRPLVLRRTKEAVAGDLPEKQEAVLRCEMSPGQAALYARLKDHYRSEILNGIEQKGFNRSKLKVLEGLLRLRQAACHPALVGEPDMGSGKLEKLIEKLAEIVAGGHKALVFSQFTKFLAVIRKRLEREDIAFQYLDGRTPPKTREKRVAAFQDGAGPPVFCISLKAGGVGLNLTAADYVFLMDPWWNPAVEAQAVDRAHRIGQNKNVFAYRLISAGSIDESVLALQKRKKDLAEVLRQGASSGLAALTIEDLDALFS